MSNEHKFLITYGLQNFVTFAPTDGKSTFTIQGHESQKMVSHAMTLIAESYGTSADIQLS